MIMYLLCTVKVVNDQVLAVYCQSCHTVFHRFSTLPVISRGHNSTYVNVCVLARNPDSMKTYDVYFFHLTGTTPSFNDKWNILASGVLTNSTTFISIFGGIPSTISSTVFKWSNVVSYVLFTPDI